MILIAHQLVWYSDGKSIWTTDKTVLYSDHTQKKDQLKNGLNCGVINDLDKIDENLTEYLNRPWRPSGSNS